MESGEMRNRTFDKLKRTAGFSLAILLVLSLTAAASAGAPATVPSSQNKEPNMFVLQGVGPKYNDVQISYSTSSFTGQPLFNYKDSKGIHGFKGNEIRTQKTEIGTMITVILESVPDLRVTTLTLLLPPINLDGSAREFKTIAIRTTSKTTIGGSSLVKGAVQSYEVIDLKGTASSVVF
jgi:hypothetical protein